MRKFYSFVSAVVISLFSLESMAQTVNIDEASSVELYSYSTYSSVNLVNGDNTVAAGSYGLRASNSSYALNQVQLNGNDVAESYGSYNITLAEGDILKIVSKFEAESYAVTVNAPEGAIKGYSCNGGSTDDIANYPAGKKLCVALNKDLYNVSSVKVNGTDVSLNYNGEFEFYVKSTTTIDVVAEKKSTAKVNVDDASKIGMQNENYNNVSLTNGEQDVATGKYTIYSPDSYYFLNKVELNGTAIQDSYGRYSVEISKDDNLTITALYPTEKADFTITAPEGLVKSASYYLTYSPTEIENPLSFSVNTGRKVEVKINEGNYSISSITINGENATYSNGTLEFVAKENANIVITAAEKATGTLNIDDASKVSIYDNYGNPVFVTNGSQTISEGTYRISCKDYNYMLNTVELNGTTAEEMSGTYQVTVAKDDVLNVKATFAEESFKLTITDELNTITNISAAGQNVSYTTNEVNIPAGAKVVITTSSSFKLNGAKLNGEAIQTYGTSINFGMKSSSTLEIDAAEYAKITAKLKVSDASHISVYEGQQYYFSGDPISLGGNECEIKVSETNGYIHIKSNANYTITSVTANGQSYGKDYNGNYVIKVTEGMEIEVMTSEIKTVKAKVIVTGKSNASTNFNFSCPSTHSDVTLNEGENEVSFSTANSDYSLVLVGDAINSVVVKKNGNTIEPKYESQGQYNYSFNLAEGDEIIVDINNTYSTYTGIGMIVKDKDNKNPFSINGTRVNPSEKLPKGIYIINGKKVFVK